MKHWEGKLILAVWGLFGAFIGFMVFAVALGGWEFLLLGRASKPWNGLVALLICVTIGSGWGLLSYKLRHREFDSGESVFFQDEATALLFVKRLMVIATCVASVYFIWQVAKSI